MTQVLALAVFCLNHVINRRNASGMGPVNDALYLARPVTFKHCQSPMLDLNFGCKTRLVIHAVVISAEY